MATTYSKRLFGPLPVTPAAHTLLYTCPAGIVAVLRCLIVRVSTAGTLVLGVGTTAVGNNQWFRSAVTTALVQDLRVVLVAGETFYGTSVGAGSSYGITGSGYELTAP